MGTVPNCKKPRKMWLIMTDTKKERKKCWRVDTRSTEAKIAAVTVAFFVNEGVLYGSMCASCKQPTASANARSV